MEKILPPIIAGEAVAVKVKEYFYGDAPWDGVIAEEVGLRLKEFKEYARIFYPHMDEVQYLHKLAGYSHDDIGDVFEHLADKAKRKSTVV